MTPKKTSPKRPDETEQYFRERAARADKTAVLEILSRAGKGNPPVEGDELDD